jgi:hypothetical protein
MLPNIFNFTYYPSSARLNQKVRHEAAQQNAAYKGVGVRFPCPEIDIFSI